MRLSRLRRVFSLWHDPALQRDSLSFIFSSCTWKEGRRVNVLFMVILSSYGSLQIFYLNDSPTGFKITLGMILLRTY